MKSVVGGSGWLAAAAVGLWLLLAVPAYMLSGISGLEGLSYAALLCLVPGWLVFFVASRYRTHGTQAMAIIAGTVVRLLFVLVGVLAVQSFRANLGFQEFIVWVLVFYLATLGVETLLLVKQHSSGQ